MLYQPKIIQKHVAASISAALVGSSFVPLADAAVFTDIENNSHKEAILSLVDQGIIKGYPDGTFRSYASITRGDATVMVARAFGLLSGENIPQTTYTDLHTVNAVTQEAIAKLTRAGIVSGFSPQEFRPLEVITRAQMAKYIANAFDLEISDADTAFPDVHKNAVLAPYVAAIAEAGITIGKKDGTFGYHDLLNRGDFAAMIYRAQNKVPPIEPPEINPITITGDDKGNNLINGSAKTYTVTLINPVSEKPLEGVEMNVTFKENIGSDFGAKRNVIVTNGYGDSVIPYQSDDGYEAEVKIKTDKNGKATFTLTGSNATVTPIVFLDGSNQEWDTNGGINIKTKDGRFDEIEFHAISEPVTFSPTPYNISITGLRTNFAAIAEKDETGKIMEHNGREYKIQVLKPDGTPFAGGMINIGIYQLLDGLLGNESNGSYFPTFQDEYGNFLKQGQLKLDSKGEAKIVLASTDINDSAEPIVWIDQNYSNNHQPGTLENGEPMSDHTKVEPTNFQPPRVDNGSLGAKLTTIQDDTVGAKNFTMVILNQSGKPFYPQKEVKANVTFEVVNSGTHRVEINTSLFNHVNLQNAVHATKETNKVTIEVGGRVTISGETLSSTITLLANAVDGVSSLKVRGSAVLSDNVGHESNSVYVYTEEAEVELPYSYEANVSAVKTDTDGNGKADQIELTFSKEVYNIEAGDFRIGIVPASQATKYGKKLILKFSENALEGETTLKYEPNYSGLEVLTDEFGNKVFPFTIVFQKEPEEIPGETEEETGQEDEQGDNEPQDGSGTETPIEESEPESEIPDTAPKQNEESPETPIEQPAVEVPKENRVNELPSDKPDSTEIQDPTN